MVMEGVIVMARLWFSIVDRIINEGLISPPCLLKRTSYVVNGIIHCPRWSVVQVLLDHLDQRVMEPLENMRLQAIVFNKVPYQDLQIVAFPQHNLTSLILANGNC